MLAAQTLMEIRLEEVEHFVGDYLVVGLRPKKCELISGFWAFLRLIIAV